ncbi:LETM1 domain-containing protein ylh47 [Coemansia sp. RSA 1365]|nr:LETM1 domain-containing protein ylh47 [Coemansia sp. RSA 1365]
MLSIGARATRPLGKSMFGRVETVGLLYLAQRHASILARSASNVMSAAAQHRVNERVYGNHALKSSVKWPQAVYFQAAGLSTVRSRRGMVIREDKSEKGAVKNVEAKTTETKAAEPKKKTLMEKIKHEALHYWHGTKLFAKEMKISSGLVAKVVWGGTLTRREQRQLRRTFSDTVRLVPFLLFVVIPFAELLLPVALKLFPNMLPSTYENKADAEKKRKKTQDVRNEMSRYLKETIAEMNKQRSEERLVAASEKAEDTSDFLSKIRSSGEAMSTADLLRVAHIFEDDLTLDNLSRPQLVSICRFMGVNSFGTDTYLRYQITNRMRYIRADDKMITSEGIDSLSVPELQSACQSRGIKTIGVSPARMREELAQWIELHLEHNIPSTLLILSRIIAAGEPISQQQQFNADALQATINSLPENLVNEATLRLAEVSGKATAQQKLEVLEEQQELIEDEDEEEKKSKSKRDSAKGGDGALGKKPSGESKPGEPPLSSK